MRNTVVSAFDWQAYTTIEHAKHGDPFADIKRSATLSKSVTEGVDKVRKKNPSHGTVHGITNKRLNVKPPEMMNAKTKK